MERGVLEDFDWDWAVCFIFSTFVFGGAEFERKKGSGDIFRLRLFFVMSHHCMKAIEVL